MTDAIVKKENTIPALSVGKFTVTQTGLVLNGQPKWEEWEMNQANIAAEHAAHAVVALREVVPNVLEGFGDDSDVYQMTAEMVKEDDTD